MYFRHSNLLPIGIVISNPFSGLFCFLEQRNFYINIAAWPRYQRGRKKALNFAKFHTRGGGGPRRAHPEIGIPLPQAHPGVGVVAQFPGRLYPGGAVPVGVTQPAGRGLPPDGTGRDRRLPHSAAATGRTSARLPGYPSGWRRYTGRRLPGQTGRFVGQTRRVSGRPPGAAALPGRGATLCRGVCRARLPYSGWAHRLPRRRYCPAASDGEDLCLAACDGFTPFRIAAPRTRFGFSPWVVCRHPVKEHIWHIYRSNVIG